MKTYTMTITKGDEVMRVTVDVGDDQFNPAYHMMSSCCQSTIFGFGDAKAAKLYDIMNGGTMRFKSDGKQVEINIEAR